MEHSSAKSQALHRLKIARGHMDKVISMLESDAYCPDIIHQSQAVQAALKKVDEIVLTGHLNICVLGNIKTNGKKKEKLTQEIVDLFRNSKK